MKVSELIDVLSALPPDCQVVTYDNEWGLLDSVLSAKVKEADVTTYINERTDSITNLYPKGDTPLRYSKKIDSATIVEIISNPGRLE